MKQTLTAKVHVQQLEEKKPIVSCVCVHTYIHACTYVHVHLHQNFTESMHKAVKNKPTGVVGELLYAEDSHC